MRFLIALLDLTGYPIFSYEEGELGCRERRGQNLNIDNILDNWGACMLCGPYKNKLDRLLSPPPYVVLKFNIHGETRVTWV